MKVEILGTGCKGCNTMHKEVLELREELGLDFEVGKIESMADIVRYGVMSLPALVIDGKVVSYGKTLKKKQLKKFIG
jgi:small redox-active disulfide protein 2